jgi:hypothetical protein
MGEAEFYRQTSANITATMERMETVKAELEAAYQRWQELDTLTSSANK